VVVANGTPAQLKAKSEMAGSVTVRVHGVGVEAVRAKLAQLGVAGKVSAQSEGNSVSARILPRERGQGADLASAVADVVANPPDTVFLQRAAVRGATTLQGLGMLVNQALTNARLWTGRDLDADVMRRALEESLSA
jgi:shikimate 5-dehydrogenase